MYFVCILKRKDKRKKKKWDFLVRVYEGNKRKVTVRVWIKYCTQISFHSQRTLFLFELL